MTARITMRDLDRMAGVIARHIGQPGDEFYIESSSQGKRLAHVYDSTTWDTQQQQMIPCRAASNVSPVLPAGQLYTWMDAYAKGIEAHKDAQRQAEEGAD